MNVPDQLRYSSDDEWVGRDGNKVRVGITVERRRVQPADDACPFPNGRIE